MRSDPSHRAEMTSEVLFGERFEIIENTGNWLRINTLLDSYTGWIDGDQAIHGEWNTNEKGIIAGKELLCIKPDNSSVLLAPGSEIFNLDLETGMFSAGDMKWALSDKSLTEILIPSHSPVDSAMQFLNAPYLWGGRTPGGIDCSGLVQVAYKINGISLPRNSSKQAGFGEPVNFIEEAKSGDLLFFSGECDVISHVGILQSPGKVLHASGSVKIDSVDHQGIWNESYGKYTHRLRTIRRIL